MPAYCVDQAIRLLNGADISQSTVTLLGLAFRGGVSDTRLSPTYGVIKELKRRNVKEIRIHDPRVKSDPNLPEDIILTSSLPQAVKGADLVILVSDHPEYRGLTINSIAGAPIYDGRGILDRAKFGGFAAIGKPS